MKTALALILIFSGLGFLIAYSELSSRNAGVTNLIGGADAIHRAASTSSQQVKETSPEPVKGEQHVEVIGGSSLEFGSMKRGAKKNHKFVFKNTGTAPVEIWFIGSTCKCTVGKFERATLKPEESTDVELEWRVEGSGRFSQTATIGTSNPDQKEMQLVIHGDITDTIMVKPESLNLGDFMSNQSQSQTGTIINYGDAPLDIESITVADEKIASKVKVVPSAPRKPNEGEYEGLEKVLEIIEYTLEVDKGIPSGNISTHLDFHQKAGAESAGIPRVFVVGRCLNPIRIIAGNDYDEKRDILKLGDAPSSAGLKKSFLFGVRTNDYPDANITLKRIAPARANEVLKVTIGEPNVTATQKLFPVTLEVPPGTSPIEFSGAAGDEFVKVIFDTNMPDSPEESIFLQFMIRE